MNRNPDGDFSDIFFAITLIAVATYGYTTENHYGLAFVAVMALIRIGSNVR